MLSTWHTCPWTEWYITHIPSRSAISERVSHNTAIFALAQVGEAEALLQQAYHRYTCRKKLQMRCHKPLRSPEALISSNKKHCSFALFSFFFLVSMSQGVSHTTEILKTSWLSFSFFWDHSRDSGSEKASSSMKGWEGHRHFIYHTKANSPKVQSFRWHGCSFNLHSFFLLRSDENCSHSASWIQNQILK